MKSFLTVLLALCLSLSCLPHNILVFQPADLWSHYMQVEPIFLALARRGHNVTIFSPYPPKDEVPNVNHVFLSCSRPDELALVTSNVTESATNIPHPLLAAIENKMIADAMVPAIFTSATFRSLLESGSTFDLVFTEHFYGQEAFATVLGHHFSAHVVAFASFGYDPQILRTFGIANAFSYLPVKDSNYGLPMSLAERLDNAFTHIASVVYNEFWYYPQHDALIARLIPGTYPRITDMLANISLILITANIALDGAKLYPPNVVEISGTHMKDPGPLDEDLQLLMDNAKNGVVYFSFGSFIKTSKLHTKDIHAFLGAFRKMKQTVLWKTDLNASDWKIPKNVHMKAWFNQTSILAHPNCVLFLTHGGLSSTTEAIRHAVPMISVPFYGDQITNTAYIQFYGYGLRISYANLTQTSLLWAIRTVTGDPRFKENVSRGSKILVDKLMGSLDTAIYWIEYVIRHRGAHHLRPLVAHLPMYQLLLLDVIGIFFIAFVVFGYLFIKLILLLRILDKRSKPKKLKSS